MKILIVNPSFWIYGGAERVIVKLANYLESQHHETTILTTQMIDKIRSDLKETRLILTNNYDEMQNVLHSIMHDFDVVNIHNAPCELMVFPHTVNSVWYCNEPPEVWMRTNELPTQYKDIVTKFIKKVVVADEFNQKRFKSIYGMDSQIVPYGIDYEFMSSGNRNKFRNNYNFNEDDFVVTQVGFIAETKNQLKTIEIFKELVKVKPNAKLVLAGHDKLAYADLVKEQIVKENLYDKVTITGFIDYENMPDLFAGSDCLLMPTKSQGSWLTVFDAMAAKVPVVVSKEMTASSIIEQNQLGDVCTETSEYIEAILNPSFSLDKSASYVKKNLSWDQFNEKMLEVFNDTVK